MVDLDQAQYTAAVHLVRESGRVSISYIQRHLRTGYGMAALIVQTLETNGIVSPMYKDGSRDVLNLPEKESKQWPHLS